MEVISLKIKEEILGEVDRAINVHRYNTRTEFIREAIRDKLTELEKKDLMKKIALLKGSLKGQSRMSEKKARKLAFEELLREKGLKW